MPVPPADLALDRLAERITALAGELNRTLERWLGLIGEFDRRDGARGWGFRGTAEWLSWACGVGPRAAREHVRVARRLRERPLVRGAFASGELSFSKVRALTRAPDAEDESQLVELARGSSAAELERAVRGLRSAASAHLDVANRGHARRFIDWWWEEDGSLSFRGRLSGDAGAAFVEAIETGAAALHGSPAGCEDGTSFPTPPPGAQRADALAEIVLSGCPRTQVVLHVDPVALACEATGDDDAAGETCVLDGGPAIPSETARRLACDADLVPASPDGDGAMDYRRRRRVVSPPLRLALERRDGHCRYPGCERRHDLSAHHIRHWAHGGPTDRDNLVLLCRFHHRLVHDEGFTLTGDGRSIHVRRPDGRRVSAAAPRPARIDWDPPPMPVAA